MLWRPCVVRRSWVSENTTPSDRAEIGVLRREETQKIVENISGKADSEVKPRRDFVFAPVRNGLDYLVTALEHLSAGAAPPDNQRLKYAVLHLQAATEVLLKARLVEEHWSLVFDNPGTANRKKYEEGDFESCSMTAALDRLKCIVGVKVHDKQDKAIKSLAKTRNALTHFGHTRKEVSAYAVEQAAAEVTVFLLRFMHEQLQPALSVKGSDELYDVGQTTASLRAKLCTIPSLVKYRMGELTKELAEVADRTVMCPDCQQWALVVGKSDPLDKEPVLCHFCLATFELPIWAEADYTSLVLGSKHRNKHMKCTSCSNSMLVGARAAKNPTRDIALCFHCGAVADAGGG